MNFLKEMPFKYFIFNCEFTCYAIFNCEFTNNFPAQQCPGVNVRDVTDGVGQCTLLLTQRLQVRISCLSHDEL